MFNFVGIQCGSNGGYKLQQLVRDNDGKLIQKTSDVLFWVAGDIGGKTLYIPISKLDLENNNTIVPSQLLASYYDRSRMLLKKTPNGTTTIPYGGIIA